MLIKGHIYTNTQTKYIEIGKKLVLTICKGLTTNQFLKTQHSKKMCRDYEQTIWKKTRDSKAHRSLHFTHLLLIFSSVYLSFCMCVHN